MDRHPFQLALLTVLLGAVMALPGCGFQPVYAGPAYHQLAGVSVSVSGDEERFAYLVESAILTRTGTVDNPRGQLRVNLRSRQRQLGVSADGRATRVSLETEARYQLFLPGHPTVHGESSERLAFEIPSPPYALLATFSASERQAAEALAESVLRTVAADLRRREILIRQLDVTPEDSGDHDAEPPEGFGEFEDKVDPLDELLGEDDDW